MKIPRLLALVATFLCPLLLHAQRPWLTVASPTTQGLWGLVYGGNQFIAVGENGTILSSPDGMAWTNRASGSTRWLLSVAWSPELKLFAAVGDAGTILTSPDGFAWTTRFSGTAQRLNGIAWGGGTFLAVGENGSAFTSPDAQNWVPRTTGDNGWLRGVAFGNGLFVVCGHDGTLLTSSNSGATFVRRGIATTAGLNAAIFTGETFYVAGEKFTLGSSVDGNFWELVINPSSDSNGTAGGLAFLSNALVVAGERGWVLSEDGGSWNYPSSLMANWQAAAASGNRVVVVGSGGAIASAPVDTAAQRTLEIRLIGTPYLDNQIILRATAYRSMPSSYQWSFNGQAIAGATSATLTIDNLAQSHAGTYTVAARYTDRVTDVAGYPFTLSVTVGPPTLGLVDTTFRPQLPKPADAVLPLADGRVYVAASEVFFDVGGRLQHGITRLNTDGSNDASFNAGTGLGFDGKVTRLIVQPDGRLVLYGTFTTINGVSRPKLARLNADGSLDLSFNPAAGLRDSHHPPALMADGRWLVADHGRLGGTGIDVITLARFTSTGATESLPVAINSERTDQLFYTSPLEAIVDAQGYIYLNAKINWGGFAPNSSDLIRLKPDGTVDTGFNAHPSDPVAILPTPKGVYILSQSSYPLGKTSHRSHGSFYRLKTDGTLDSSFQITAWDNSMVNGVPFREKDNRFGLKAVASTSAGAALALTPGRFGRSGIVLLNENGDMDPNFSAELDDPFAVQNVYPLPNGQLLVSGRFTSLNGITCPYLARLTPNRAAATTRLSALSTRAFAGAGASTLIIGFITKNGGKNLLTRSGGPALALHNIPGALADPQVTLYSGQQVLTSNDDWGAGDSSAILAVTNQVGLSPFAEGSRDAALLTTLPAGIYTALITGKNSTSGVALGELYDTAPRPTDASAPRLTALSARAMAGTEDSTLIAGFVIDGENTRTVLIRGIGPGLTSSGVPGPLADPVLRVFRGNTLIAANDNWGGDKKVAEASLTTGVSPLEPTSKDAVLLITLPPGVYTAQVSGANGTSGVALVDVYEVP